MSVRNPIGQRLTGLGSSPFARRYLGNRYFFLFLRVLRCFSSPGLPLVYLCIQYTVLRRYLSGFPHSEIFGSQAICASPKLIAAYHVLHRLLVPRHSPCALSNLTFILVYFHKRFVYFHRLILSCDIVLISVYYY